MSVFRLLRIVLLMAVLFVIVVGNWLTDRQLASWERPVWVTVYPIVADGSDRSRRYVRNIDASYFEDINDFLDRESSLYGISLMPVLQIEIAEASEIIPPALPDRYSPLAVALWSLKMRFWAWRRNRTDDLPTPDIQMFVLYHDSQQSSELEMSVAMREGRFGLVNAFADRAFNSLNQVVMAHELLHVFGATDKYITGSGEPEYPYGYADPNQVPVLPQTRAEIMGGRIPITSDSSVMPVSLDFCKIGQKTAEEIGFFEQLME